MMSNLAADVRELFAGLDGYERYDDALDRWSAWRGSLERQKRDDYNAERRTPAMRVRLNAYAREYRRARRLRDPAFRHRCSEETKRWRERKFGLMRKPYGPIALKHGTSYAYKWGCRCDRCRAACAAYAREYRARKRAA